MVRRHGHVLLILAIALAVFVPTLGWGLPSRDADKYLFGVRRPWTGEEILRSLDSSDRSHVAGANGRGADVDADPILDRSKPVVLNDTDAKRAAIVQRYRLMSGQPDEFIQFKALAEMAGRSGLARFDPRLYQYGGLWIYPVGALVRTSMLVGLIESPPLGANAKAFYLDHPEVFGRFYVVARAYSTLWGCVAALAIAWIARRATGNRWLGVLAAACFIALPVTRTAAHEAKPHLAGAALCLCGVIAATRYVETGRRRWLLLAGGLCGAAMGMVVSMLLSLAVLPAAVWLHVRALQTARPMRAMVTKLARPVACAFAVFAVANPFVLFNAVAQPQILRSNLGNSTAMYGVGGIGEALADSVRIAADALTPPGLVLTIVSIGTLAARGRLRIRGGALALLAAPCLFVLVQFVALAAGKPAEYARFGLVVWAAACVFVARSFTPRRPWYFALSAALLVAMTLSAVVASLVRPAIVDPDRLAGLIAANAQHVLRLGWEPAPWSCPPLDLFDTKLVLVDLRSVGNADAGSFFVFPINLASQIGEPGSENLDWRTNDFGVVDAGRGTIWLVGP